MIRENLLDIMLENQHLFEDGLCLWLRKLHTAELITEDERDYIGNMVFKEQLIQECLFGHLWSAGDISYRIEWLKSKLS